jgi:hypothetical protein
MMDLSLVRLVGVIVFGAILTLPVHAMVGSLLAPWKLRERSVLVMSATFAYFIMGWLILGTD